MLNQYFYLAVVLVIGIIAGYLARRYSLLQGSKSLEEENKKKAEEAEKKSKEIILEAKEKAASILADAKSELKEQESNLKSMENRLFKKEENLEQKSEQFEKEKEKIEKLNQEIKIRQEETDKIKLEAEKQLEKVSQLSTEEAKNQLFQKIEDESRDELAQKLKKIDREQLEEIEKKSLEIITTAIERYSRANVAELTTTSFPLNDEEFKGKIIGREGRNIRAIEKETGVELLMDESPDAVIISSFDPLRREIAKLALEKLVKDGRIQPAKIEEKVEEARQEINKRIQEIGENAAQELGIYDLPKEIIQLLGKLHFRTSYGQNVLTHSIEVAYLSEMIAAELGLNTEIAKKAGLLHDIGKALSHEIEGSHIELGIKLLKKYNINQDVIIAMQSHHGDYPFASPLAYIITAADALSAARPGARRDTLENYIKRLGDLEKIAQNFDGVKNAYAVSAGRELRVFVIPEKIDDFGALKMAQEIAGRIQSELNYPGEIKVNVIRETKAVEYAR
jgi:ribonuclease Y